MKRLAQIFLLSSILNPLYAETIPALKIQHYPIDEAFTFNDDRSITEKTWQQACLARNMEPTNVPNGRFCLNKSGNVGAYPQDGDICVDGVFKVPGNSGMCIKTITECPHAGWTLSEDKSTCYRPDDACWKDIEHVSEIRLLAAIVYGESHASEIYEEMAGIASAVVRRRDAQGVTSVNQLVQAKPGYTHVVTNGNIRFKKLMCGDEKEFKKAYDAAENALHYGEDYSNGGCFWDGYDLKRDGTKHIKYIAGFHYTDPSHNIFSTPEPPSKKRRGRKIKGKVIEYNYTYISTGVKGRTIFWELDDQFLFAQGAKQCR